MRVGSSQDTKKGDLRTVFTLFLVNFIMTYLKKRGSKEGPRRTYNGAEDRKTKKIKHEEVILLIIHTYY